MTDTNKNPWKGWTSYEESDLLPDENGKARYSFVGREKEIDSLYTLICNYPLTTIYGRSGIGKTSLLQAGVFPLLRMTGFVPVICRFDGASDCADIIIKAVEGACTVESLREGTTDNLVDFFLNSKFTKDGDDITPVIVLDQFEDLLKQGSEYYSALLTQIHTLVFDDFNTDIEINFRFVISIREDFLYLLEDAVDIAGYTEFKENRYRLLPMREESADRIISLGGNIPEAVRERLKALALKDGNYTPALLSFYCHELYDACKGNISEASMSLLENESKLIERYYKSLFSQGGISKKSRRYIEENLQKNGMRSSVKQEAAEKNIPEFKKLIANDSHKLLQTFRAGDDTHVELIHDKVAEIIQENLNTTDNRRWRIMFRTLAVALTVLLLFTSVYFQLNDIHKNNDNTDILSPEQTLRIDSDYGSLFVRTLTIPNSPEVREKPLNLSSNKYSNLRKIVISEGCDSIRFDSIPDYSTIVIPASVSKLTINQKAKDLYFEVDENNPSIKLYDGALWRVYPEYEKDDELIWASPDNEYITFPPDKHQGRSTQSRYYTSGHTNRNNYSIPYHTSVIANYIATIELSNTDKTIDLSNDTTLIGKRIRKISNLEYIETLVLPRSCHISVEAVVNAPKLRTVIVSDSTTLIGKSFVYCPNLKRVELSRTAKLYRGNSPVFYMCPPIDFKIAEGAPYSFSNGVLKGNEFPYLIHSNTNELQSELFREEIEAGKMSFENGYLGIPHDNDTLYIYNWDNWSTIQNKPDGTHLFSKINFHSDFRCDLSGLTHIHIIKSNSTQDKTIFFENIPKEIRKRITLHIPYGTSMEFLNIPEASYFKDVVEDTFFEASKNVIHTQIYNMTWYWKNNILIVLSVVLGLLLLVFLIPAIRRKLKYYLIYIPLWLLLYYGLYWTIFNLTPPKGAHNIYVQIAEAIISGAISLIITLWLVNCNRHSFDPVKKLFTNSRKHIREGIVAAKNSLNSFLKSQALVRHRKTIISALVILGVAGVFLSVISIVRSRIDRKLDDCAALIGKSAYYSAAESLPMPNAFFSSRQTAVLDSLTNILTEIIQPLSPFSTIEESWKTNGIRSSAFSSDKRLLAVSDNSGHIVIYDWESKTPTMSFDIPFSYSDCKPDFNNGGSLLLLNDKGRLFIADTEARSVSFLNIIPHSYTEGAFFANDSTIIGKYDSTLYQYNIRTGEEVTVSDDIENKSFSYLDRDSIAEMLSIPKSNYKTLRLAEFDGKIYKSSSSGEFWKGIFSDDSIKIAERPFSGYVLLPNQDYYLPFHSSNSIPKGSVYKHKKGTFLQLDSLRTIEDISPSGQKALYSNQREDTVYVEDIQSKDGYAIPVRKWYSSGFLGAENLIAVSGNDSIYVYSDTVRTNVAQGRAACYDPLGRYILARVEDKRTIYEDTFAILDAKTLKPLIYCGHAYANAIFTSSGELLLSKENRIHRYSIPRTLSERIRLLKDGADIKVYTPEEKGD